MILLIISFFIFSNLNSEIIKVDLFFVRVEGVTVGFSLIVSLLIGAVISLVLQLPRLVRRNSKVLSDKKDENP